jgi:hypothetical protein
MLFLPRRSRYSAYGGVVSSVVHPCNLTTVVAESWNVSPADITWSIHDSSSFPLPSHFTSPSVCRPSVPTTSVDSCLLGCDAVWWGDWFLTFQRDVVLLKRRKPRNQWQEEFLYCLLLEDGGATVLRNATNHHDAVSHPKSVGSSAIPLADPRISQIVQWSLVITSWKELNILFRYKRAV